MWLEPPFGEANVWKQLCFEEEEEEDTVCGRISVVFTFSCWLQICNAIYGHKYALLHPNRVFWTFTILTQICCLSHLICFHISLLFYDLCQDLSIHNNTYSFKPGLRDLLFLILMLSQAKPFLKSFYQTTPPNLPPISMPPCANPIISTKYARPTINKDLSRYAFV